MFSESALAVGFQHSLFADSEIIIPPKPRFVAGFAFSADGGKVALVRKNRPRWQRGRLNAIGGSIEAGESHTVTGKGGPLKLEAFLVQHGRIPALGYRIGDAAYTPDLHDIPEESWPALQGLDLWIVDGLRYAPHPSHFSVADALSWIERFKPKRAVITNMHSDLDYEVLGKENGMLMVSINGTAVRLG
mgnify:CR=1 FL=1